MRFKLTYYLMRGQGTSARRKMWSNVGLQSNKGPAWGNMGRTFIRAVLNSSRNISPQDNSAQAAAARRIQGFHELDGIEFMARIDVEKDGRGELRNVVKIAVEPGEPGYSSSGVPAVQRPAATYQAPPASSAPANSSAAQAQRAPVSGKPSWAQ